MRELVLNFHGLGEPHPFVDAEERRFWWSTASFASVLDRILDRPAFADPQISITFDDGNSSDALLALPELAKRGLTARFFLCAGRIGMKHYLDDAMIQELLGAGMSIGSHGMEHRDWRGLDGRELDIEIGDARRKLEDVAQRPVTTVSIPFGSYDRRILRRLRLEPWDCVYTSDRGITHVESKMKPRETLDTGMQGRDIVDELVAMPSISVRCRRAFSRLYKRIR